MFPLEYNWLEEDNQRPILKTKRMGSNDTGKKEENTLTQS